MTQTQEKALEHADIPPETVPAGPPFSTHVRVADRFDEAHFQAEIATIFKSSWLPVCHTFDIPQRGDFVVREIPGVSASLLVVRGKDGAIRAFHNVCRHRGNKLACDPAGTSRVFVCGYHGWAYNLDGTIRGVTDRESFPPMDNDSIRLKSLRVEERHTFVFVNADDTAGDLDQWLDELAPREVYDGFFERFDRVEMTSTVVNANWNLGMDAFSESYHTAFVHKNTLTDYLGGDDNPERHSLEIQLMERHARLSVPANAAHRQTSTETMVYRYTHPAMPSFETDSSGLAPGANFGGISDWGFDVVKLFPNVIILTGRNWFIETYFWPISKDQSRVEWALHLLPAKTWGERVAQEYPHLMNREVACEDLSMVENQHEMLNSQVVTDFWLSFQEILLAHHYDAADKMIAAGGAAL